MKQSPLQFHLAVVSLCLLFALSSGYAQSAPLDIALPSERSALDHLYQRLPATVVFDSNRGGTFGIYTIKTNGTDLQRLVDGPGHEIYPEPSPDGKLIAYARAQSPALRAASEIWIMNSDGTDRRRLAVNGTFPTFSPDGKYIYFERERKKVMRVNLDGGRPRVIFPRAGSSISKYDVAKPRISPDGKRVAFISNRIVRYTVWWANLNSKNAKLLGFGCEPVWFADGLSVAWIGTYGVAEGSGIVAKKIKGGQVRKIEDAGPPRGHEYYPSFYGQDRYLLYSASRGPQDHDPASGNYQIMIKDRHANKVFQLTSDPFTNRWPKIVTPEAEWHPAR